MKYRSAKIAKGQCFGASPHILGCRSFNDVMAHGGLDSFSCTITMVNGPMVIISPQTGSVVNGPMVIVSPCKFPNLGYGTPSIHGLYKWLK